MKFMKIVEYIEGKDLGKWNQEQKDLWLKMVELHLVDRNDVSKFLSFGEYFDSYYKQKDKSPSVKEIIKKLGIHKKWYHL